jgi:TM2 domain-containing membrane protein YozV
VSRDLRRYARQTRTRLLAGLFLLLFLLGDGLIYLFYGRNAALTGLLCLLGALVPVAIIVIVLAILDRIVKHANPD